MNLRSLPTPFTINAETFNHLNAPSGLVTAEELIAKNPSIVYECAVLSLAVYDVGKKERTPLPDGWKLLIEKEYPTSYAGACYVKNPSNPTHVVCASRGTVPDLAHILDFIEDLGLKINRIPLIHYFSLLNFYTEVGTKLLKDYGDKLKNVQFVNTGHSLGAVLADLTGTLGNWSPTITFENPGSHKMIKQAYETAGYKKEHVAQIINLLNTTCRTYQAGVNAINTCNKQLGRTFRIQDLIYDLPKKVDFPCSPNYKFNFYYLKNYLFDQHSIDKIANKLKSNHKTIEINNPIGFQSGYIDYLDKSHKDYWDNYFKVFWDDHSGVLPVDHDKFIEYCYKLLEIRHTQAININLQLEKQPSLSHPATLFGKNNNDLTDSFVMVEKPDLLPGEQQEPATRCTIL